MSICDIIYMIFLTVIFHALYRKMFPPRKILFITGDKSDYNLMQKINKRDDKYQIDKVVSYHLGCMME